jgi:uncharacterized protein (DUF1697 family)
MARRQSRARSNQHHVRYVALLRGINVGRAKRVAMSDLRSIVEALGFTDVRTLLNSGNVVFTGQVAGTLEVAKRIEEALVKRLGVSSATVVLTGDEVQTIIDDRPGWKSATNPSRLLVAVTPDVVDGRRLGALVRQRWGAEALSAGKRAAYLWCPDGVIASPLAQSVGRLLGDRVTMRNWTTMAKLHALVSSST